ncbi:MAG TPA: flagellar protein FlaG [Firmicutes bacterium]|nr:flagellar protein FlaG [Bacillota bacterium]
MSLRVRGSQDVVNTDYVAGAESARKENAATAERQIVEAREKAAVEEEVPREDLESAIERINGAMEFINKGLKFSVHEGAERIMVEVIDKATNEVIKEIPPRELLETLALIREMVGLLIDAWA